jgi:hypothetical protein
MTHAPDFELLFAIPLGLAIAFMVWVFGNLTIQLRSKRRDRHSNYYLPRR